MVYIFTLLNFHGAKLSIIKQKDHTQSCMALARWGKNRSLYVKYWCSEGQLSVFWLIFVLCGRLSEAALEGS